MLNYVHTTGPTRLINQLTQLNKNSRITLLVQILTRLQVLLLMEFHSSQELQNLASMSSSHNPTMVYQQNQYQLISVLEIMITIHTIIITQPLLVFKQVLKRQLQQVDYVLMILTVTKTRLNSLLQQDQHLRIFKFLVLQEMVEELWVLTRQMDQHGAHARQTFAMEPMLILMEMEFQNMLMLPQPSTHTQFLASQEVIGHHLHHSVQRPQDNAQEAAQDI